MVSGRTRIASRGNSVHDTDPAEMERVVRTHAFGAFYLSKLVLPSMREQPRGDVVMISSAATQGMGAFGSPYNMGKAALEALAMTLYKEERRHNIHVNIVAPGLVETDFSRVRFRGDEQKAAEVYGNVALGGPMRPEDVADCVVFALTRPPNVNVDEIVVMALAQTSGARILRES